MPYDKDNDDMPFDKDNDDMPYDKDNDDIPDDNDNDQMPNKYANDNEMATIKVKYDIKWPIETSDIDDEFMREYDDMRKSMEYRQINDYYEAQGHIQSAMKGDTPVKTGQNRQCIDNVNDYDREHDRILNSVHHRVDLGPNMLPGAQQHTTVGSAAALTIQDKIEGKYDENIRNINGQYRNEMYKRAENMVPQLDGTYNVSDGSDIDSHIYLELASSNIIAHRTRGQKQRYEINERANTNRCLALKEDRKPNTNVKTQRQKVPDDEDIDISKIV